MLEFKHVTFQYDSEDFNIIDDLSFTVEPEDTFAFGLYKGHYTYPMVAQFSTGILAHFSISIYTR